MNYKYHKKNGNQNVIITLHGTGADEHDLDGVANFIDDQATVYGLRGDVNENGMLRWFKRTAPGVFDESDIHLRAKHLAQFLHALAEEENFSLEDVLFLGFSNGANMIAALLQLYPSVIRNSAILHGQIPLPDEGFKEFSKANVFVSTGKTDHMIPYKLSIQLKDALENAGVSVEFFTHPGGHQIPHSELAALQKFYQHLN